VDLQNDHTSLRVGMVRNRGIITSAYLALRATAGVSADFGFRFLTVWDASKAIYGYGSGLRQNLDFSHFKRMPVSVPPPAEQAAIVRFLDWANGRLERAIRAKRKVIALLGEQKQAIIHRAVTRGLDPSVPLKPSGIPWLGDIPRHWEVRRLRHVCEMRVSNVDKHTLAGETPVRLCNYVEVYRHERIGESVRFMRASATEDERIHFGLRKDDVLITKDSEQWNDIGVPALVEYEASDLVCGYHLAILRPRDGLDGPFLLRALQCQLIAAQFHVKANGVTRYGLSHGAVQGVAIPVPPPNEQAAIVQVLDHELAGVQAAISRLEREIELLREYRTRLVADVVTGKLDVREAAARLPEEAPPDTAEDDAKLNTDSDISDEEAIVE
jgi:type I restriction enzyme S subunit